MEFHFIPDEVGLGFREVVKIEAASRRVELVEEQCVVLFFSLVVEEGKLESFAVTLWHVGSVSHAILRTRRGC